METPKLNDFTNEQMPTHQLEEEWQNQLLGIADVDQADHGLFGDGVKAIAHAVARAAANPREREEFKKYIDNGGEYGADMPWQQQVVSAVSACQRELEEAGIDPSTVNIHNVGTAIATLQRSSWGNWQKAASILEDAANNRG